MLDGRSLELFFKNQTLKYDSGFSKNTHCSLSFRTIDKFDEDGGVENTKI